VPRQSALLISGASQRTLPVNDCSRPQTNAFERVIGDVEAVHIVGTDDPLLCREARFVRLTAPDMA